MHLKAPFRRATEDDAAILAELINASADGMPEYLWGKMAGSDDDAWEIGRGRASREKGGFSYRNAYISEEGTEVAGALVGYTIQTPAEIPDDLTPLLRPLQELVSLATDTWYITLMAVRPQFRGLGHGTMLLGLAEQIARNAKSNGLSVILPDTKKRVKKVYEGWGYKEQARREMVKEGWSSEGREWVLLTKPNELSVDG